MALDKIIYVLGYTNVFLFYVTQGSEDNGQWLQMGNTINEIIFGNNYVAPCMQRVVCSIVSVATHTKNQTSADKMIDGLSR